MKTKKDFPFLTLFIATAVSVVAFLPLRIYQYFEVLEADTGFYEVKNFSVYLLYILMAFVVIFSFVMSWINKNNLKNHDSAPTKAFAVIYAVAAIGFVADAATNAISFIDVYNSYVYNFQLSMFKHLSQSGALIFGFEALFAIASAVYFFVIAAGSATKKDVAVNLKTIALAPSLWAAMRLLLRFKSTISFTNVSDLLLELFAIVFMMLFFFSFAMTNSRLDKGESFWKTFAYGIPAAVFAIVCFVPRAVLLIIGQENLIADGYTAEICDLTVAIMIFAFLISKARVTASNKRGN